jgi:AcrR family transcriptional regulator
MNEKSMANALELTTINFESQAERPERADAAANRALILETAERLFAERGVENVCMTEIAEAAGVGKGTLYRRYANKAELCLALMDTQLSEFQDAMLAGFREFTDKKVGYLEQVVYFLESLVDFTEIHTPLLVEVERGGLFGSDAPPAMPHFWQIMTIQGLLRQAERHGEISKNLDLDYLGEALLAPLQMDVFRFQRNFRGYSTGRIKAGLRTWIGLLAKPV